MQQFSLVDGGDGIQPKEGFESGSQREAKLYLLLVKGSMQNTDESKSWMLKCYLLGVEKMFHVHIYHWILWVPWPPSAFV